MTALVIIVVAVIVVFAIGFVAPRKSRRAQAVRDHVMRRGEAKADRRAGLVGDAASGSVKWLRRAGDRTAEAGRGARERVSD